MTIKTKYNLGEKVWIKSKDEPSRITVQRVEVLITKKHTWVLYNGYYEGDVYASKKELKNKERD